MSRIGKLPVPIPSGVQVNIAAGTVKVKGPQGELMEPLPPAISAEVKEGQVLVTVDYAARKDASAMHGMARARINNMVEGVSKGFSKTLQIIGLGYRVEEVAGQTLKISLGKSHPVIFDVPKDIKVAVDPKKTLVTLSGASKDLVGETSAKFRALRPPEPYKGTGIRYQNEPVRKKAGKTAAGAGTAGAK